MAWVNAIIQGVLTGGLYALFACGLSLMFGVMKVVNLAHGDLAVVAGYVAIGRALVANPRVLLLDELSLGLAPVVVQRIYGMLPQILATGLTVLLVEQDVSQALRVASHLQCLLEGHTTLEGRPSEVTPEQVEAAYFGFGQAGEGSEPLWSGSTTSSRAF